MGPGSEHHKGFTTQTDVNTTTFHNNRLPVKTSQGYTGFTWSGSVTWVSHHPCLTPGGILFVGAELSLSLLETPAGS